MAKKKIKIREFALKFDNGKYWVSEAFLGKTKLNPKLVRVVPSYKYIDKRKGKK